VPSASAASAAARSMPELSSSSATANTRSGAVAQRRGKLAHSRVVAAEVDEARLREMVARYGRADPEVQAELLASASGAVLRAASVPC
jgi:hypothetical protein